MDTQTQDTPNVTPAIDGTDNETVVVLAETPRDALGREVRPDPALAETHAILDAALAQTSSRGVRRATDRTKDLATIGDVRNAATLVAQHLLNTMRVSSEALGNGVASLAQMVEDEAKAAKEREEGWGEGLAEVDRFAGERSVALGVRVNNLVREMEGLAGDASTLKARLDELATRFQNHEAVNLAAHSAAARRIARLERSAWARTVAFFAHWWRVARGRLGVTGTP